jgi:hypothetical protein
MNRLLILPVAAALLAAGSAHAQQRSIVPGQLTRGMLSTTDGRLTDDTYFDEYVFSGRRGETVVVSMESGSFDAFLHLGVLRYGQWQVLSTDDDGGGGTNSRIELQLPEDGTYAIRANSVSRAFGEYTVSLVGGRAGSGVPGKEGVGVYDAGTAQPYTGGRGGRFLEPGRRVDGYLSSSDPVLDGREPFHIYTYSGRRGETLSIIARSTDFDAYLVIGTAGGRHGVASALARNDDGAGGRDARIDFTLPYDGEYVIRVNPMVAGTGNYTLEVQSSFR